MINEMKINFTGVPQNEAFARSVIGAFTVQLNPTVEELSDVKTAVSEAVTNAIIHGYEDVVGNVEMSAVIDGDKLTVTVTDHGRGIADLTQAMQPFYTSKPEQERSGMGFTVMETFMRDVSVTSTVGEGTAVTMTKYIPNQLSER